MPGGVSVSVGGETPDVTKVSISRGRQDELDRTTTGSCDVTLAYASGSISDFVGEDLSVSLTNPHGGTFAVFTGSVDEVRYDLDESQIVTRVVVSGVDAMDIFAGIELTPGLNGEVPLPSQVDEGNIFYEQAIPQDRIEQAVLESGFTGPTEIFTGNVVLKDTIYSPRTSLLTVIDDACDGEFPGVANRFVQADGTFTFHGRLARFNPGDTQYHIDTYAAGDGAAAAGSANTARIHRCGLASSRHRIINAALATPEGILDADYENQVVSDLTSQAAYGLHSWSAENLLCIYDNLTGPLAGGSAGDYEEALATTLQFAQYYIDNYDSPQIRVEPLVFRSLQPSTFNSPGTWNLICNADISDIITLTVSNPGISIADDFFIEGIQMDIVPANPTYADVTATYDLSPRAYWSVDF